MNILCLDQFGELGGAQRCLLDLLPAFTARGYGVHLAAPPGELLERARLHGTADPIQCGPYTSGRKTAGDMLRFARQMPRLAEEIRALSRRHHADLIYVNGPRLLPAVARARDQGAPVLFHSHSLLSGAALRLAGRAIARTRATVVASSRFVAAPLLPYARNIRIVYNGVRRIQPAGRQGAAEFRIGVIGRIAPEKGQADFLHAARILSLPQCRFVICGAPLFSNRKAVEYRAGLDPLAAGLPVEFCGWREDVESILATLDLLVVPSTGVDATPRVILEAFAAGVPVVAFRSGGIPEIIEHGVTGWLVDERSPAALAAAMRALISEPKLLCDIAAAARAKALGSFSLERYQNQILEAIAIGGATS